MRPAGGAFSRVVAWVRYAVLTACNTGVGTGRRKQCFIRFLSRFAENFPALRFQCMSDTFPQCDSKRLWHPWYHMSLAWFYRHRFKRADDDSSGRGNVKGSAM